jgi:hypothetical protein
MPLNLADRPLSVRHPDEFVSYPLDRKRLASNFQESLIHPVEAYQKII